MGVIKYQRLHDASIAIGKDTSFFNRMRHLNKSKFDFINSLNSDLARGYNDYLDLSVKTFKKSTAIYYFLEDKKLLYEFSKKAYYAGIYKQKHNYSAHARNTLFNASNRFIKHHTFINYMKLVDLFNAEYMNANLDEYQ